MDEHELSVLRGDWQDEAYDEARADLLSKLDAKIRRRELTSVKAVHEWVQARIAKAKSTGRWPEGW